MPLGTRKDLIAALPNEVDWVIPHKTLLATGFDGFRWTETEGRATGGFPDELFFKSANIVLDAFELMLVRLPNLSID